MTRAPLAQRLLLALAALAAGAWLAVSLVGETALERATKVSKDSQATPAALEQAVRDAERAEDLRPGDNEPELTRAQLLVNLRRNDEAVTALEDVIRSEPDNVKAWFSLFVLTAKDKARSRQAFAHVRELDPVGTSK